MRTVKDIEADLRASYVAIQGLFEHWERGMHDQFMSACWNIYDCRQELIEITGSRDKAQEIVGSVYNAVFHREKEQAV